VTLNFTKASGELHWTAVIPTLPGNGSQVLDLGSATLVGPPASGAWYVTATASQPIRVSEVSRYDVAPADWSSATYEVAGSAAPSLARFPSTATAFAVAYLTHESPVPQTIQATYYDLTGTQRATESISIPARGMAIRDARSVLPGQPGVVASAEFSAPVDLRAVVDDFAWTEPPCIPPSSPTLDRVPAGDVFTGNNVHFAASAAGSTPLHFAWMVNSVPVGSDSATFDTSFATAGSRLVGVTISNTCNSTYASTPVQVLVKPPAVDLSGSFKRVNLASVEAGDVLTYTLVLTNSGPAPASATLVDPIPAGITYVPNSARASDGSIVSMTNGEIHWSGQVVSRTPTLLQFAASVPALSIGSHITNSATLSDGQGNHFLLEAASLYNPGYGLTINSGNLYTRLPTVTLSYKYGATDNITHYRLSNDGGFASADTTDWLAVDPAHTTYGGWVLSSYGDLMVPRTVYIKFRTATGAQLGPFQDDIILDRTSPTLTQVQIFPGGVTGGEGAWLGAMAAQQVRVRVTGADDNSGVGSVQIANEANFSGGQIFPATGATTQVVWTVGASGQFYVRVLDRAGNASPGSLSQTPIWKYAYLPLVQRH
jgi:uncharacterized repeat protein (TIGR01451 family)